MGEFWKILTLVFIGFLITLIITHSKSFATVAGSLFTGVNGLGTTLTSPKTAS